MVRLLMPELQLVSLKILTASATSSSKKKACALLTLSPTIFCDNCDASIKLKIKTETIEIPVTASISPMPLVDIVSRRGGYK